MRMRFPVAALCVSTLLMTAAAGAAGGDPTDQAPGPSPETGQGSAAGASQGDAQQQPGKSVSTPLYTVKDGNNVDPKTLMGWKTWRAMACERCHGPEQEGLVGPSLVNSLKVLTKEQFHTTIMNGRPDKGMPNFGGVHMIQENWENLYAYLKGRSEGNVKPGHLYPIDSEQQSAQK
jgi:mono/diheme cytochrome c family protein